MNEDKTSLVEPNPATQAKKHLKKRYEKPAIIHSQPLEAMASLCTPRPPGKVPSQCSTQFS